MLSLSRHLLQEAPAQPEQGPSSGVLDSPRPGLAGVAGMGATSLQPPFRCCVLPGNESVLMGAAMEKRSWWHSVAKGEPCHFWWGGNGQRPTWSGHAGGPSDHPIRPLDHQVHHLRGALPLGVPS